MLVDPVQVILLLIIIVLTVLLVVLGIQVFFILRELRKTINKTNKVLDNADSITENIEIPLSALASLTGGLKAGSIFAIVKFAKNLLGRDEKEDRKRD